MNLQLIVLVCQAFTAPFPSSNSPNPICSLGKIIDLFFSIDFISIVLAQLIVPGQGSWLYKYTTEVKLSVANAEIDLTTKISADVNIRSLNDCDYLVQVNILSSARLSSMIIFHSSFEMSE